MKNKKIVITGGSGFLGQALVRYFGKENEVVIVGRHSGDHHKNLYSSRLLSIKDGYNVRYVQWTAGVQDLAWAGELDGADLVLNLAGKSVNCRYHRKQMQAILDGRIHATKAVGAAIRSCRRPPGLWINAASATIYRHSLLQPNDEYDGLISELRKDNMPYNWLDALRHRKNRFLAHLAGRNSSRFRDLPYDFSVRVCRRWEEAFFREPTPHTRKVALRSAIILGRSGIITPFLRLCRFGLGGQHGNGKQMFSWVHVEDVARMIAWLFENNKEGIYNCASPNPVTNSQLMKSMRNTLGVPFGLPVPTWLLELGAWAIGTETELMLKSRWVRPAKATREGFTFRYPFLEFALDEIIRQERKPGQ